MPGTWSKLLDSEEEEDEDVVLTLALAVATTKKRESTDGGSIPCWRNENSMAHIITVCTNFNSMESDSINTFVSLGNQEQFSLQDCRTSWEGNMCTHNQDPHMVSACAMYASVTWKSYRSDRSLHGAIFYRWRFGWLQMWMRRNGDMACQHNLMGAIFFMYTCADADADTDMDTDKRET